MPGCRRCSAGDVDPEKQGEGLLEGRNLAISAGCAFIMPAAGALFGAAFSGPDPNVKFMAAAAGLVAGGAVAWVVSRLTGVLRTTDGDQEGRIDG